MAAAPTTSEPARDLVITRVFDAPLALVWRAWTDPEQLVRWFFPAGCGLHDPHFEVRQGGRYRYTYTRGGETYRLRGVFLEIVPRELLVFTHGWANEHGVVAQDTRVTVIFEEAEGRTHITVRQVGLPSEEVRLSHAGGWGEALDHLAALLAEA